MLVAVATVSSVTRCFIKSTDVKEKFKTAVLTSVHRLGGKVCTVQMAWIVRQVQAYSDAL